MTRALIIILLVAMWTNASAQSLTAEKDALYKKVTSKEISQDRYNSIANKWNSLMKSVKYPELSLDSDSLVHYTYVSDFSGVDKDKLFSRTLEWLAISKGLLPAQLYSNREDGRIIFDDGFKINDTYTGFFTCIVTVVDSKLVLEFINLSYQSAYQNQIQATFLIGDLIPVVTKEESKWKTYLGIMGVTNKKVLEFVGQLRDYQLNFEDRYPLK